MLLDVRMPRQDGVSAAPDVAQHATVLMLTYSDSPEVVSAAVKAGARGYLVHGHFTENELLSAVRMAARGHRHLLRPGRRGAVQPDAPARRRWPAATGCRNERPT